MSVILERAVIEIFGGCNYSCPMCPQSTGRGKNWTKKMPFSIFTNILDQLEGKPTITLEGSGEAFLAKDLHKYIQACTDKGLKTHINTNGSFTSGNRMQKAIDAGLSSIRFSIIGYNASLYKKWMSKDYFKKVLQNIFDTKEYIEKTKSNCSISTYHLILDNSNIDYEINEYRKIIDSLGTVGNIWKMHNWAGGYNPDYKRDDSIKKSCGRPFAPEITIRAGGLHNKHAAVTPCCQTMGDPNESKSVLGHLDTNTLKEVFFGEKYTALRTAHREENFDSIDYCKNCDFLYDDPEVLVWSNDETSGKDIMTASSLSLDKYKTDIYKYNNELNR